MSELVERFTGRVAEYVQYRERYDPAVVLPLLEQWCGLLPTWTVADVGAGTGMLSDVFLANGNRVIAVEPNAEMRDACASLHQGDSRLHVLAGTAEATGLAGASAEMVSVGRALHWFDIEPAMREFRRVLKPGGWLTIIAFGRSKDGREENLAYEEMMHPYSDSSEGPNIGYAAYERLETMFASGTFRHAEVPGLMQVGWQDLRGLTFSLSNAPRPGSPEFAEFERALREYFARYETNGQLTLTTRYWLNAGQLEKLT